MLRDPDDGSVNVIDPGESVFRAEPHERRAPAPTARGSIGKALDAREAGEDLSHAMALKPLSPTVNQPDLSIALLVGSVDVLLDDGWNVSRLKAVQVDDVFDLDRLDRLDRLDGIVGIVDIDGVWATGWLRRLDRAQKMCPASR
jgi:hypothetical protein